MTASKKTFRLSIADAVTRMTPMGREFTVRTLIEVFHANRIEAVDKRGNTLSTVNLYNNVYRYVSNLKAHGELAAVGPLHEGRYKRIKKSSNAKSEVRAKKPKPKKTHAHAEPLGPRLDGISFATSSAADILEQAKIELRNRMWQAERRQIRAALIAAKFATQHEISEARLATIEQEMAELMGREAQALIDPSPAPAVASPLDPEPKETPQQQEPPAVRMHVTPKPGVTAVTRSTPLTVPERVAMVMGNEVWDIDGLERALRDAGEKFKSGNLRSYIAAVLSGTKVRIMGPDGKDLCKDGKPLEVHKFVYVERSRYRVATEGDMQIEACGILGGAAVRTPADDMFEEQGIDIRPDIANSN